jgi:osmotically-inducible protein OsmY
MSRLRLPLYSLARLTLVSMGALVLDLSAKAATPATTESAGELLDDTVITTRVKAAFLNEPALKSFQIGVKTYKDVVQLSGFVDSLASKLLAGKVAGGVKGVATVRNDLIVK